MLINKKAKTQLIITQVEIQLKDSEERKKMKKLLLVIQALMVF
jgi:hypothetical protein